MIRETVRELAGVPRRFGLSHGDLTPSQPAPARIRASRVGRLGVGVVRTGTMDRPAEHRRDARVWNVDAGSHLAAFLEGMGLELAEVRPTFERYRRLQLLDLVRWAPTSDLTGQQAASTPC